jgi:hypothetical protein
MKSFLIIFLCIFTTIQVAAQDPGKGIISKDSFQRIAVDVSNLTTAIVNQFQFVPFTDSVNVTIIYLDETGYLKHTIGIELTTGKRPDTGTNFIFTMGDNLYIKDRRTTYYIEEKPGKLIIFNKPIWRVIRH